MLLDHHRCYRVLESRDARFDGCFVAAVRTTGIYCRPSCPAVTPKPQNVSFLPTAAAAQLAGYRACKRCLPDAVPGSKEWDLRGDLVARAVRLIADGVVERDGVPGLAARLGYSTRQLNRVLTDELGAGALALARSHRAQAARILIETTTLPMSEVAFAAGFASIRQFNATVQEVYATSPSALRARRRPTPTSGAITLRLPYRRPLAVEPLWHFWSTHLVPGVDEVDDEGRYTRSLRLPRGSGVVTIRPGEHLECTLRLQDLRDLTTAVTRVRRLLDLDADPAAVHEVLGSDPALAGVVGETPGLRVPGAVDGGEIVLRAVLGQQVSVAAGCTAAGRLVAALGDPVADPVGSVSRMFPTSAAIADGAADVLAGVRRRIDTVVHVAAALADGGIDAGPGADPEELRRNLLAIPGIGPWTAGYVLLRALGGTDELLTGDLVLRKGAATLGLPDDPRALEARSRHWRPWRSYAGLYLWRAAGLGAARRSA